jgi:hypothetical protein
MHCQITDTNETDILILGVNASVHETVNADCNKIHLSAKERSAGAISYLSKEA